MMESHPAPSRFEPTPFSSQIQLVTPDTHHRRHDPSPARLTLNLCEWHSAEDQRHRPGHRHPGVQLPPGQPPSQVQRLRDHARTLPRNGRQGEDAGRAGRAAGEAVQLTTWGDRG